MDLFSVIEVNEEKDYVVVVGCIIVWWVFGKFVFFMMWDDLGDI